MSIEEDRPDPENLEWRYAEPFKSAKYLTAIGRGDVSTRDTISSDDLAGILTSPKVQPFDEVMNNWRDVPLLAGEYPHDPGVKFRAVLNRISPRSYDKIMRNGDSYFSAVAMLLYGDADLWYLTRAQHFQYFVGVLQDSSHPRYELYERLNHSRLSKHPLSYLRLSDRIKMPNCWVHHEFVQQVTADLYGILLVIFSSSFGNQAIADIQVRGSYNAPHRFLRYMGGNTYWPLIPELQRPSEYRFPRITFDNTKGELGIADHLRREDNDGLLHPWRRPFPDTPVPEKLSPVPITTLGPLYTSVLETVLWISIKRSAHESTLGDNNSIYPSPDGDQSQSGSGFSLDQSEPPPNATLPDMITTDQTSEESFQPQVDYFQITLKGIERIAQERQIDISSTVALSNQEIRRERIASSIEIWQEQQIAAGHAILPLSKTVWQDTSTIPTGMRGLRSSTKAKPGYSEHPSTRLEEMRHNSDGYIKRVLMGVNISPRESREENIAMYQQWIETQEGY